MKRKAKSIGCIAAAFTAFVLLISCRKDVPEGQIITAEGTVTDYYTQALIAGVNVYLFG